MASTAGALALGSDRFERLDFGSGGDRVAAALQGAGERLRGLESGKLYLYTLGLFIGALLVIVATVMAVSLVTGGTTVGL
jgi:NADH-quinone oxidoreductase subunit L